MLRAAAAGETVSYSSATGEFLLLAHCGAVAFLLLGKVLTIIANSVVLGQITRRPDIPAWKGSRVGPCALGA